MKWWEDIFKQTLKSSVLSTSNVLAYEQILTYV